MATSIRALAALVGGEVVGDGDRPILGAASVDDAGPTDVTFVGSSRYLAPALASGAGCLLVHPGVDIGQRSGIAVADPKLAFVRIVAHLYPERRPDPGIDPTARIDPSARLGRDVHVGAYAVIAAGSRIGDRVVIEAGCALGRDVEVGDDSWLHPRVVLYAGARVGARARIHAGAVLGSDGFGFVRDTDGRLSKFPQVGGVEVGDDVEVGANTTVDRGALGATVIGSGTKIDNLVQIAHNVTIGRDCTISAQTGIAGSSTVADGVTLGGQVGVGDHVRIRTRAMVGSQAGIASGKIIREDEVVWGTPARPLDEIKRQLAHVSRLGVLRDEVARLSAAVERLEAEASQKK